jgi:hypothetical protein
MVTTNRFDVAPWAEPPSHQHEHLPLTPEHPHLSDIPAATIANPVVERAAQACLSILDMKYLILCLNRVFHKCAGAS